MSGTKNDVEIQPLRTLDDFLLESARFQIPDIKNPDRWGNRIVKNLMYYQTNYFLLYIILFMIVGIIHPKEIASGSVACVLIAALYIGYTNTSSTIHQFRNEHKNVTIVIAVLALYFIYHLYNSILVLLVAIIFPLSVIFIHSSLRLRNFRNKLSNQAEMLELKITPMGLLLKQVGLHVNIPKFQETKFGEEIKF